MTALPAPPEVVGKKVLEVDVPGRRRVVAVSRFGVPRVPDKDLTVQEGDILHISVIRADAGELGDEIKTVGRPE
ncbi:MAG: TrkA C-terminal domain-containing protein [Actinomycetota bacterium]|nr:TrkA C-terminal domain-containing protein [Actinomycetota bacterium]